MASSNHLTDRIWFQQTRNTVLIAVVVGMAMSLTTIFLDLRAERQGAYETARQVVSILRRPATQAVFNIDQELAQTVVRSLLEYHVIHKARVIDDIGSDLASLSRPVSTGFSAILAETLFGKTLVVGMPLQYPDGERTIGQLEITIDTHLLARQFFQRSLTVIISGLVRNILLATILLFLFHKTLGRPVLSLIEQVSEIDPARPEPVLSVDPAHQRTELGKLTERLNQLLKMLQQSQTTQQTIESELRAHQDSLEQIIEHRTADLRNAYCKLEQLAATDSLTSILNRRAFYDMAGKEVERAKRTNRNTAIVLLDIDHFKRINDAHGHFVGDQALQAFASEVSSHVRQGDIFARVGGEEFALLLHDVGQDMATQLAERIRVSVEALSLCDDQDAETAMPPMTVSIGIANARQLETYDLKTLVRYADSALYQAKSTGRNRVVTAGLTGDQNADPAAT